MAATNFTPIQLYRTNTASTTAPSAGNLSAGELAINYNDGGMILFAKNTTGNVIKLMNNPANLLYPTADGSANQAITTNGSGTLAFASVALPGSSNTFTAAQTFRAANAIRSEAASTQDAIVIAGRAGGTSSYAITLTPAALSANRTLTLPEPGENVTLGYLNTPINSQSAAYTLVLEDSGKTILHPSTDANARTYTIPANSSVAYPTGTVVTFINMTSQGVTIAITTDTMYLEGTGTTGSRTLAQYGIATAVKMTSTTWIISGSGLT